MAIEIANFVVGACRVRVPNPVGTPSFWSPPKQQANVGFAVFAPAPAPLTNSERVSAGVYRMHMVQTLSANTGQIGWLVQLNATSVQATAMNPYPPGWNATSVDIGAGTDIIVTIGGGPANGPVSPIDGDFTLVVLQFPQSQTNP